MNGSQKDTVLKGWFDYCLGAPKDSVEQSRRVKKFTDAMRKACRGGSVGT